MSRKKETIIVEYKGISYEFSTTVLEDHVNFEAFKKAMMNSNSFKQEERVKYLYDELVKKIRGTKDVANKKTK